jgi:replicative DNA helicase
MKKHTTSEILDSLPPSDTEAERCVLCSIILAPEVRPQLGFLKAGDFYSAANATLFEVLMGMEAIDGVLLVATLRASGKLDAIGGLAYVAEVIGSVAVAAHAVYYGRIVRELALKRRMIYLNCDVLKALYSGRWSAAKIAEKQRRRLNEIFSDGDDRKGIH